MLGGFPVVTKSFGLYHSCLAKNIRVQTMYSMSSDKHPKIRRFLSSEYHPRNFRSYARARIPTSNASVNFSCVYPPPPTPWALCFFFVLDGKLPRLVGTKGEGKCATTRYRPTSFECEIRIPAL